MKTVVLTCLSCVLLAGIYFTLNKKNQASGLLSFRQNISAAAFPLNAADTSIVSDSKKKDSTSNTLNDSHWLDDATFQKAVEADLMSENQPGAPAAPQQKAFPEKKFKMDTPKSRKEGLDKQPTLIKPLILELGPDTTAKKSVPVEVA